MEFYDFVVAVDRTVRDRLIDMAEAYARASGGRLSEWERKIRLLCDFDGAASNRSTLCRGAQPLDVPTFNSPSGCSHAMDVISDSCERIVRSLLVAGL